MEDLLYDEMYTDKLKRVEGNIFLGMLDNILTNQTGDGIKNLIDKTPRFNNKKVELEEIKKILLDLTNAVVKKLYHSDCGEYSLRNLLEDGMNSSTMHSAATNNITYGVMSSVSKVLLASLFYYVDEKFIFFYIRDMIVEPNYRGFIKETKAIYDAPNQAEVLAEKIREFTRTVNSALQNMMVEATKNSSENLQNDMKKVQELIVDIPVNVIESTLNTDIIYPIPEFLDDVLKQKNTDAKLDKVAEFITKLKTTFTLEGLRTLFKEYGNSNCYGDIYEIRLARLQKDRLISNGLTTAIDRLNVAENKLLHKLLIFEPLQEYEKKAIAGNTILSKVQLCISRTSSVGNSCSITNDKLTITTSTGKLEHFYLSENLEKDKTSPFRVFGHERDRMENIYRNEPTKFCANQTVITQKERSSRFLEGKTQMFRNQNEKTRHKGKLIKKLLNSELRNDQELMNEVARLRSGAISELKYVKPSWFDCPVIDNPRTQLLVLSEMEGIMALIKHSKDADNKQ